MLEIEMLLYLCLTELFEIELIIGIKMIWD